MLVVSIQSHANGLVQYLEGDMALDLRIGHLNTLKMNIYLLCQFIELYEAEATEPSTTTVAKVQ